MKGQRKNISQLSLANLTTSLNNRTAKAFNDIQQFITCLQLHTTINNVEIVIEDMFEAPTKEDNVTDELSFENVFVAEVLHDSVPKER